MVDWWLCLLDIDMRTVSFAFEIEKLEGARPIGATTQERSDYGSSYEASIESHVF